MTTLSHLSAVASLIADQTRVAMLVALMDGRAHPAGDLAQAAGVTPQTASAHLGKLLDGGLVLVEARGRHRYYRISGNRVATAIEHLAALGPIETRTAFLSVGIAGNFAFAAGAMTIWPVSWAFS